ncbi:T9SS type B sorting domain-containing protein [Robiginitalea sediminis]|uniref:T9SS type B sorting domain-containing protein n=1 Tax=Robiginitalea sediminis TaxID=1982593 RepID=UPI000B4BA6AD|nr:T9SS type B sorting domain-containing protein [Robiginitalea sediminis]
MRPAPLRKLLWAFLLFALAGGYAQEYNSFDVRYQANLKGDLTFIANNIVNRQTGSLDPEDPYNATGNSSTYNDWLNMQYIDVDSDPTTFSSSSATFAFQEASCNLIRYAGLYWSATYPSEQAGQAVGTNRQSDFNQVKLRVPGGSYVDITADEVIYDGFTSSETSMRQNSPYACYADVTALLTALPDPSGEYTVANIRSVTGSLSPGGGAAGGWTLVIVYENPTLSGKLITTFDGFARVRSANPNVDINYSGFNTIPVGPVRANIGVAALEGDNRITGDRLRIRAASNGSFTTISDPANPSSNFFNSNISQDGSIVTTRNPNSVNTLGYDTDMFLLNNPLNNVIPNNETAATFRFTSNGDQYYPFFNSFNVEIIEPNIVLEKKVEDIAGNDITGAGVNLGQLLDYVLSFQNIGNDDGTAYTIRDVLPLNVTLDELNLDLPTGVTYTYDSATREVVFNIPDNLIEEGDPVYEIRMRVQVAENCFDFIDACTDLIQNLAYSTYQGVINNNQITDDPSVSDFDTCGFVTPGATNFLLDDLENCDFYRTVQLCGNDVVLDAGDNFDSYIWYLDNNGDGLIDAGDTVITDGDPDNDPSTLLVTETGQYIVDKIVADPCKGFEEIIEVVLPGQTQVNPIITLINDPSNTVDGEVVTCPNDGDLLPKVFLCGLNDTELIEINIPDATSIVWERLDEGSCSDAGDDCANKNSACTWNQVDTGNDFLAADAGEYRVVINYQNGCFTRFYFNIFKNPLNPQYTSRDIICASPGNITVTNMPADYEYQLLDAVSGNVLVPYSAGNGPSFDIASNGAYTVAMRQVGVVDGCEFFVSDIGILTRDFQVDVTPQDVDCNGLGAIAISVLDVEPQYYYEISQGGTVVDTFGPSMDNNYTFDNLNAGTYDVRVTTDDGCLHTEQVIILDQSDLELEARISQHITCREGNIQMSSTGGQTPHTYAIWEYTDEGGVTQISYPDPASIPSSEFQTSQIFDILDPGTYLFVVVDRNNCFAISNPVEIEFRPSAEFDPTTVLDALCFGDASGSIQFNLLDDNGYQLTYYLFNGAGFDENNYDYANALATNTSGNFPGLPAGDYAIVINQRKGSASCDYFEYQTISGPAAGLAADAALTQAYTCLQDGIIQAQNVAGGTAPYEYSIDGLAFGASDTFTGLTAGNYTITVRDANGCTVQTAPIAIDPLNLPDDLSFTTTALTCPAQTTDVTATVSNGTAPFTIEIIAPAPIAADATAGNSATFNGLAPDTYTFRVTDANGCTYQENLTINPITPITVSGQQISPVTCFGDADGEALFSISGFATSYDYNITGPAGFSGTGETNASISLTGLAAGTYDITVTDTDTNCSDSASVTIEEPLAAMTLAVTTTQPTCLAPGTIVLSAADGWGGYSYTLTYPDATAVTNGSGTFTGLVLPGDYTATVTDANGCVATSVVTLVAAVPPVLDLTANDICYDDATGLILTATVTSGGDGNFLYRINNGAYGPSNVFSGLGPGTYTVDVIDGNDCTDTATITVDPELTLSATADPITACATDTDVVITAAGGDGSFVYAVVADGVAPVPADFGASNTITVTGPGDYDVYVRDNNGAAGYCEAALDLTIAQDPPLTLVPTVTDVLCFGDSSGAISIAAGGGNAPYLYSINDGATYQTTPNFVNLPAGTYNLRIQDAEGCEATDVVTINEPAALVAEAAITQAFTCLQLGEITVGGVTPTSGGSGSYQYSLSGGAWSAPTAGGIVYSGLTDGTYTIRVRDANAVGCVLTLPALILDPLPAEPVLSTSVAYNCDGTGDITVLPADPSYTYSLDGGAFQASNAFTGVAPGNHLVTVNYGSDCTTNIAVNVATGLAFGASLTSQSNLLCNADSSGELVFEVENFDNVNGFEYQVNGGGFSTPQTSSPITLSGLAAGPYTIEVRDVLDPSCAITLNATLTEPAALVASATITDEISCTNAGATITASAVGGTAAYQYQLEDNLGGVITAYQGSAVFTAVPAGDYIVRVRDANGCDDPIDVAITIAPPQTLTFTAQPTACYSGNNDGEILVTVTDGNGGYLFNIDGGPWLTPSPVTATTYTFGNLSAGTYDINVRDAYGCVGTPITVTINPQLLASAVLTADLTCLAPATIDVNASGASGTYSYEWSDDAGTTWNTTGFAGNTFSTNTDGTYVFRVTDTTAPTACVVTTGPVVVSPTETPVITSVTPTDILCNGDLTGMLDVVIDTSVGFGPYVVNVVETSGPTNYGTQTTGLPAGNYEVTVTDAKGCVSAPFPVTISQPDPINYTINLTPITCNPVSGTDPGSISVENLTGGTAEYTYYLTGNNGYSASYTTTAGGEDHTFSILEFGIYEVDVVDANGCSLLTTNIIASPPDDLDIDVSTATVDCAVGGTAIVTVSSVVGSGNYEFAILDSYTVPYSGSYQGPDILGGDTATFTGLTAGITYTFVVHDLTTNCYYFETAAAPINSPSNMTVSSMLPRNITCTGAADGSITFDIDNFDAGATAVDYQVFNFQSNAPVAPVVSGTIPVNPPAGPVTLTNLGPLDQGVYYVLLTEVGGAFNGCSIATPDFTITQSTNLLQVTADSPQNDNCNPNAGIITATAQFGTPPYTFQYLPDTAPAPVASDLGWISNTTANVEAGDYIVYVKDANDCIQSDPVTVGLDPRPEIALSVVDECVAEGTFEVLVTLTSAGMPPYQISVNGGAWQPVTFNGLNQYTVTGLSSGAGQSIAVRGVHGCADTDPFSIEPPLQFNAGLTTLLDCEPAPNNNAEITIDVTSGSGSYDYEVSGPVNQARGALPSNPYIWDQASAPGTYTITIYDTSTSVPNCLGTIDVEVPPAVLPQFTEAHTDVTCNGDSDGTIQLFQTDTGINPLTYSISPVAGTFNAATDTFENLPAGTYDITATGTNGCTAVITGIVIAEPNPIAVPAPAVTPFACPTGNNPSLATITVNAAGITGGSGVYTVYEFINDQGTPSTADDLVVQSGNNPLYTETTTAGGSYIINVYDSNGCVGSTTAIIPAYDELLTLTAAITNPLSCVPGADGEITLTATSTTGNTALFEYSIDNGATWQPSNVFGGLSAGTYSFLVRHTGTGCELSVVESLTDPNTFDIAVDILQDVTCFGTQSGQVTLELVDATYAGGFDWTIYDTNGTPANTADDVVVVSGNSPTNGPTAAIPLFAGEYLVEMTQTGAPQCAQTELFNIAGPPAALSASVEVNPITCAGMDGSIEIYNVQGGWGGYAYYVGTSAPSGPGDFTGSPLFANLGAGTYEAWIIDAQGCQEMILNNIVLADPAPITATLQINQENCTNLEGEIEVVGVSGGQGSNYTYQLILNGSNYGASQSGPVFSNLGGGSYEVRITDQWGCSVVVGPEVLYDEMTLVGTVDKPLDCTVTPDGEITITTTGGSGNFDYTVTFPDGTTTASNNTGVFTGLSQAGTYTFVVSDLDTTPNCTETLAVALAAPTPVTLNPSTVTDVSCNGGSDGSIRVNLQASAPGVNDNPPYTYILYQGGVPIAGPQSSPLFDGLSAGNYVVEAISALSCTATENVTITEPTLLTLTAAATAFACAPDNTVSTSLITATVPVGAGTAPYLYSLDGSNYQTANTFNVADTGMTQNLTVYVRDANGCVATAPVTLEPINAFTAAVSQNAAITCLNPEEVLVTVTDDGNPANSYTFELLPVGNPDGALVATPTNTTAVFELTVPGSYVFRITDNATGCYTTTLPYDVAPYDLIQAVASPVSPVTCFGGADGALSINISGYTGTYDYEVFQASGVTTGITGSASTATNPITVNGLSGGNYFVRITETATPFCAEDSNTITIVSPDMPLTAVVAQMADVTCSNDQGEIQITPAGGFGPYDIVLTNTTTGQAYTATNVGAYLFTGLAEGAYTVVVTDAAGCVLNDAINLVQPVPVSADITAAPAVLACYGDTNGVVTAISVAGGSGNYQYQLNYYDASGTVIEFTSGAQSSPVFTGLGSGIYSITVTDGWSCDVETVQVTISEPSEVESNLVQTAMLTCTTNAEMILTASGGTAPYEFSADGLSYTPMSGGDTHTFSVTDGVYQYYVRDAQGCEANLSNQVSIEAVPPLTIDIDDSAAIINCTGEMTASLVATATGGLGNYQYELFGDAALSNLLAGPQAGGTFASLGVGSYWIRVTSQDCEAVTSEIIITEPVPLQIDREEFTDVTCAGEDDGTITVEVSGGTGNILYAISPNLDQFDDENVFTELAAGVYDVIAQDENGCFITFQFTISEPMPLQVDYVSTPEVCAGSADGAIDITISGGTAPYRTAFNSNQDADFVPGQTSFPDLAAGTYVIFIRDAQDCETNVIVEVMPGVNLNAVVTPVYECTDTLPDNYLEVVLEDPSVSDQVMYALDSTDPSAMQLDADFSNLAPGPHFLAISHANGCVQTIDFEIDSFEPLTLVLEQRNINEITAIAEGGSPEYTFLFNGDDNGSDNTYYITETGTYTVQVVDQLGCVAEAQIFMEFIDIEFPNYFTPDGDGNNDLWMPDNTEGFPEILIKIYDRYGRVVDELSYGSQGWDGMYDGRELPTGDYWYVVKLNGERDQREFVGHFTLYR